jgi:hypothetical protein
MMSDASIATGAAVLQAIRAEGRSTGIHSESAVYELKPPDRRQF